MTRKLVYILSILAIFSVLFNSSVITMSVVYILSDLGSSAATASYATAFYGVGNALTVPLALTLRSRFGTKPVFLVCQIGFTLATLFAGHAPNYPIFLIFRLLQGVTSGPLFILLTSFLGSLSTDQERATTLKLTLSSFICAPILGASWGGWIAYDYNWRYIFIINVFFMILLGIALYLELKKYPEPRQKTPFDSIGYSSFVIGFSSISFFLTLGQELDWFRSHLMTASFYIGIIFLLFFVLWSLKHPNPVIEFSLLKEPVIPIALLNIWLLFAIYFGMTLLLSIWLTLYVEYTVIWVAVLLGSMIFSSGILLVVMQNYLNSHKVWIPFGLGIIFLGASCFYTSNFNIDINLGRIAFSRILGGCGFALLLPSLVHLMAHNKAQDLAPKVFTLFQIARGTSSALGVTIFYTIWLRRQVFYYERLGGALTPLSPLTNAYYTRAKAFNLSTAQTDPELATLLTNQATSLALNDCCYLMGLITIILFGLFLICYLKRDHLYQTEFFVNKKYFNS
jgi:DHA2 family multidrug resistance protein